MFFTFSKKEDQLNTVIREIDKIKNEQNILKTNQSLQDQKITNIITALENVSSNYSDVSIKLERLMTKIERSEDQYQNFVNSIDRLNDKIKPTSEIKEMVMIDVNKKFEQLETKIEKSDDKNIVNSKQIWIAVGAVSALAFILTFLSRIGIFSL